MEILIGGDVFLGGAIENRAINEPHKIWGDSLELFSKADLSIINLESPITTENIGISKTGPCIKASTKSVETLKKADINLVTLANNHILDYGEAGLLETIRTCQENNIEFVGAGKNLKDAQTPYFIESENQRIAILNFAENEWASAKKDSAGANPMNFIDNLAQIKETRKIADLIILIIHGGHEFNPYPSPRMVKQYRFYADSGVDLIVGHHTHCVSGFEIHNNVPIIYSLGNLIFHNTTNWENWFTGILLKFNSKSIKKFEIIPFHQNIDGIRLYSKQEKETFFQDTVLPINKAIENESELQEKWRLFVEKEYANRLFILNSKRSIFFRILKKIGLQKKVLNRRDLMDLHNFFRCEAHYDLSLEVLDKFHRTE
ncbi:CapA family protein [Flagellimonas sp. HMM57]|uniref:CapA family protein n=1 Tax=unclassified Flagellimonas TaxID=2644544 RepID=UPI0013D8757F|nr:MULTISPECIES: CapA family protein [unclassified Flagellimonas]UII77604.1 CapA family protein [Flagellimonas sp. HMM57]